MKCPTFLVFVGVYLGRQRILTGKTHQVCLWHVLVVRRVVRGCFGKAVVTCRLGWLSMLAVRGALRSPAEEVDGFSDAALDVDLCGAKPTG